MRKVGYKGWISINLSDKNFVEPFEITFTAPSPIKSMSFNDAAAMTAKLMASEYDNLHLLLSGGLDSEFVAKTFLCNQIPFTPVIVKLQRNKLESWYAYKFCAENNLTPLEIDLSDNKVFADFAEKILIKSNKLDVMPIIGILPNIIADMLPDSSIITGYGEPFYNSTSYDDPMGDHYEICDHDFYLETEFGDRHPGAFFTYTPELFSSLINEIDYTVNTQEAKAKLYGLLPRPKLHEAVLSGNLPPHIKYANEKSMKKYSCLPEDRFTQILSKEQLILNNI